MREGLKKYLINLFLVGLIFLFLPAFTYAQRPPIPAVDLSYLRVDFIIPGARPSALGGAFIGAALDETAAAINPAGLTYLTKPGASLHQRQARIKYQEPEGSPKTPDAKSQFKSNTFDQNMVNIVYPIKRVAFSTFRQVAVDSRFKFETRQFLTTNTNLTTRQVLGGLGNFPGRRVDLNLELVNNGIAVAFALSDRISIGVSGKLSVLTFNLNERIFLNPKVATGSPPAENSAETTYAITTIEEVKSDPSFSFGFLGKLIVDKLFVGAVLNINPSYDLNSNIFLPEYKLDSATFPSKSPENTNFKLAIPDTYGFGLYYVVTDKIRFTLDLVRVEYSDLLQDNDLNAVADDILNEQSVKYEDPDGKPDLTVDDVLELHLGMELLYKLPKLGLIPLRLGLFTNTGHRIYATEDEPDLRRLFPKAKDRVHFTFGVGFILSSNLMFEGSINTSTNGFELIGSTLITFPFR